MFQHCPEIPQNTAKAVLLTVQTLTFWMVSYNRELFQHGPETAIAVLLTVQTLTFWMVSYNREI